MTASLMPFYRTKADHVLSLDVRFLFLLLHLFRYSYWLLFRFKITNYRSDIGDDLSIDLSGIYVASRQYEVKQLIGSSDDDTKSTFWTHDVARPIKIEWREQATLHFLISPILSDTNCSTLSRCVLSTELLDNRNPASDYRITDFICIENAYEQFTVRLTVIRWF